MSDAISPFRIDIPQSELDDLKQRIMLTRWPEQEPCDGWEQGIPLAYTREVANYWANDYDWRRCEAMLNRWPNFRSRIEDVDVRMRWEQRFRQCSTSWFGRKALNTC